MIAELERLGARHGKPRIFRSDNGREFIAASLIEWLDEHGIAPAFIEHGSPQQNPFVDRFNGTMRDEVLNGEEFASVLEARVVVQAWVEEYNTRRPHRGLGMLTPRQFAAAVERRDPLRDTPPVDPTLTTRLRASNMRASMRAIITGAAGGIGRAVAHRLAADAQRRGGRAEFLLVDVAEHGLSELAEELARHGAEAHALVADLAVPDAAETLGSAARDRLGALDALVSNAGVTSESPLAALAVDEYERTFAVNTRATLLLAQAMYPLLKAVRGCIVATASLSGEEPTPPLGVYSASKAALIMLVRQLAFEWGPDGIRCNCVSPGTVHTPLTDSFYSDPERRAARAARVPLRRIADPEDIAAVIAFLAGPDAAYVTGVNVVVDGGLQTSLMPAIMGLPEG